MIRTFKDATKAAAAHEKTLRFTVSLFLKMTQKAAGDVSVLPCVSVTHPNRIQKGFE